jgi:3'-5' exonuclease
MITNLPVENILFIDIETVPAYNSYEEVPERIQKLWDKKSSYLDRENESNPSDLYGRAGIYAEFGKIVCISSGYYRNDEFRLKSCYGDDEKELLEEFSQLLLAFFRAPDRWLCAHNGKEFDYPYLSRRFLVNGLHLPAVLDNAGKKPWEIYHLDTMELWKFGDFKHYTSLDLLAAIFGSPTPKDDIDGSEINHVYWQEHDLERIRTYCQKDVLTVAQLFLKFQLKPLINENQVVIV